MSSNTWPGRDSLLNVHTLLLVVGLILASVRPSHAEVGAIVLEPSGALGFFTRVGHACRRFSREIREWRSWSSRQ